MGKHLSKEYVAYIHSPEWFATRGAALAYHGKVCRVCRKTDDLHVHHKTYKRLGYERMTDLVVLCKRCHEHIHLLKSLVKSMEGDEVRISYDAPRSGDFSRSGKRRFSNNIVRRKKLKNKHARVVQIAERKRQRESNLTKCASS